MKSETKYMMEISGLFFYGIVVGRTLPQWEDVPSKYSALAYWIFFIMGMGIIYLCFKRYCLDLNKSRITRNNRMD